MHIDFKLSVTSFLPTFAMFIVNRIAARSVKQLGSLHRCALRQPYLFFSSSAYDTNSDDEGTVKKKDAFGGSSYQWDDPLRLRSQLNEEEVAVWDAARAFCEGELMPGIVEANRHEIPCDKSMMKKMGQVGMLGSTIPPQYGGAGLGYVSYGLLATEVERVDSAYRSAMSVQSSHVMYPIFAYGTEDMKRKYLPELASGNMIG